MKSPSTRTVACLGDSITKGMISYDWVRELSRKMPEFRFLNHGINGDLAYNALQRLEPVIAAKPDVVVILLGTNDVLHAIPSIELRIKKTNLPQKPDKDWFRKNLHEIIQLIQTRTTARILIASMPVIGEGLHHSSNHLVQQYNEIVRQTAEQYSLIYLPFHEALVQILEEEPVPNPIRLEESFSVVVKAMMRRLVLWQSYDTISDVYGLKLTTDTIHLNSRSGKILGDLVAERLRAI
jgi:lysophospholipase L1-like esterase